jgi:hypothetical protein
VTFALIILPKMSHPPLTCPDASPQHENSQYRQDNKEVHAAGPSVPRHKTEEDHHAQRNKHTPPVRQHSASDQQPNQQSHVLPALLNNENYYGRAPKSGRRDRRRQRRHGTQPASIQGSTLPRSSPETLHTMSSQQSSRMQQSG